MNLIRTIATAIALPLASLAFSQSLSYATASVEVRAGVLVVPGQVVSGVAANPAPHVWGNLDRDSNIKPAKWTFVNPAAPTVLTSGKRSRWSVLDPAGTPAAGAPINKRMAPYWEVELDTIDDLALAQYDVLSLTVNQGLSLNANERDKLRRYVDQGGTLWIDLINDPSAALGFDQANPVPVPFNWAFSSVAVDANLFHPLLAFPNAFSLSDLSFTDFQLPANRLIVTTPLANNYFGAIEPFQKWIAPDSGSWQPVAGTGANLNTVSVAKIGQGFMVLTSRGITANVNRGADPLTQIATSINRGYNALGVPNDVPFVAAARFAINVVSLGGLWTSAGNGSRHTNGGNVDLTPPLLSRFKDNLGGSFAPDQQPALFKGRVIVTQGNQVFCYDSRPDRDIDGDGDSDDGVSNTIGTLGDLIWVSQPCGSRLSAPTVVEVPRTQLTDPNHPAGFTPTDQVWVTDENSNVYVFDLDAEGATQAALANWPPMGGSPTIAPPSAPVASAKGPFAPVVHESLVFITDSSSGLIGTAGRVWVADLESARRANTTNDWFIHQSSRFAIPSAGATVGYVPIQDGSGGLDRVLYIPGLPANSITSKPASLTSIWLGARSESPVRRDYAGGVLTVTTRASYAGLPILLTHPANPTLDSLGLKITLVKANGDPVSETDMRTIFGSSGVSEATRGVLQFASLNPMGYDLDGKQTPANPNDDVAWRLDYTVDWGQAVNNGFGPNYENYVRGNLELPDDNRNLREVIGSVALAPNGNIFVVTSFAGGGADSGGTLMNLKENRGPGNFSMLNKFDLYDRLTFSANSSTGANDQIAMPPVITDEDQLVLLPQLSFLNQEIHTWRFVSGPTIRGGQVYVTASGVKNNIGAPVGVVMAFRANVPTPSFEIEGTDSNFTLVQADPGLSLVKNNPEQYSVLQPGQFTVEPIPNSTRSRVLINNLMNVSRGRVRDAITMSLPLMVRRPGQSDAVIEPEAVADNGRMIAGRSSSRWNSMLWYIVFNGYKPGAGPIVAGQTLYQGGASILPSLITGGGFVFKGMVFAMDADINPNDEFLIANSYRPWMLQYNTFLGNSFANIRPSTAVKWPQFKGIEDWDDLRIRILQATIDEDGVTNIAGGDDTLAITGPSSLYAYSKSDFLVVDSGRVGRFDPSGNPVWITDQTIQAGKSAPTAAQGSTRQLSEPNRMYPTGDNGYWIVDTGNNRVVRIDAMGRELRTIENFRIDPQYKPDGINDQGSAAGMSATETLKLRRPKDLLVFETFVDGTIAGRNPFTNPRPLERWVHTVIADSGNSRVVELVDRYEVNPQSGRTIGVVQYEDPPASGKFVAGLGVLYWHTPEELTGKGYSYNSIARTVQLVGTQRHNIVAFGFGNVEPGTASLGLDPTNQNVDRVSGYGGVVLYDGPNSTVIREFQRPAVAANTYLGETPPGSGNFTYSLPIANQPSRMQKLVGIRSVSVRYVDMNGNLALSVMVTDSTGVYELVQDTTQASKPWVARWMLPVEAYVGMRHPRGAAPYNLVGLAQNPHGFRPMYASRLDSNEVLVVNGFVGTRFDNSDFQGEVVLVDGSFADAGTLAEDPGYSLTRPNLGFNRLSVKYELPPTQGVRGIVSPVFAQRQ